MKILKRTSGWLKEKRKEFNLSQQELAKKSKVSIFAIQNIEQGQRKGSSETWKKLESIFNNKEDIIYSHDNDELIEELKADIEEFGSNYKCLLFYEIIDDKIIFNDYNFISDDKEEQEKDKKEKYVETNLGDALLLLEEQNKIL